MKKTYYSTRPPASTSNVTSQSIVAQPTTQINIPGNYYLKVNPTTGKIDLKAGSDIKIDTGSTLFIEAVQKVEITSPSTQVLGDTILGETDVSNTVEFKAKITSDFIPQTTNQYELGKETEAWKNLNSFKGNFLSTANVGNPFFIPLDDENPYGTAFLESAEVANAQRKEGGAYFNGGVGIQKDLNVGGWIYGRIRDAQTSTTILITATNVDHEYFPTLSYDTGQNFLFIDEEGLVGGLTYNPALGRLTVDKIRAVSSQTATSSSGTVRVEGGVSVGDNVFVQNELKASDLEPHTTLTGNVGTSSTQWLNSYVENIYTKLLTSTEGPIQIAPKQPVTEIIGDIRVRGQNPIGTAPVIRNTLYVTMDGDDTNDGRAPDPSRACRTIGGAMNSPYYQIGTQILVSAGRYLEDNPLLMKPYTSIRGSDIRTTFIEPINKTQDLFHMDSGCYLNYMTFLNGRSGLLEGEYTEGTNRGAYCTSFPPLEGENRIDLYQSPYIQNCTNQSGPWLKDGTMFVPNQTIQIPEAVAVGSWEKGTSTIVLNVTSGSIVNGMKVSTGQQNPGFYNARTLMLANKPFLQEQVVNFVDKNFTSATTFDTGKCSRDIELIVDGLATDLITDSTSETIFSGLQYWRQNSYVDQIADVTNGQKDKTIEAISYLKTLSVATLTDATYVSEATTVGGLFDTIITILSTSTDTLSTGVFSEWITNQIVSNGLADLNTDAFTLLLNSKDSFVNQTINYINSNTNFVIPNTTKCNRDIEYILLAVMHDMLFAGESQISFAGLQYWQPDVFTGNISAEIGETTSALIELSNIAQKLILGQTLTPNQNLVQPVTNLSTATSAEATKFNSEISVITGILNLANINTFNYDSIVTNGIYSSNVTSVKNAYNIIQANKEYLKAEVIAYIDSANPSFSYSRETCARDVGYILDSISFDLLYGGNKQAVQSGFYYYNYTGSSSPLSGETPQAIAAFEYIKKLLPKIINNKAIDPATLFQNFVPQIVHRPEFPAGTTIESDYANRLIDKLIEIIQSGPSAVSKKEPINLNKVSDEYIKAAVDLVNENIAFIKAEVIAYLGTLETFVYDKEKCKRDIRYIVDSVAFDLLHGGNKQSVKSGAYYFGYYTESEVVNEKPQVTAAYSFIKSLLLSILKNQKIENKYSSTEQVINLQPASDNEIEILASYIDLINGIISNGPSFAPDRIPINTTQTSDIFKLNAYAILKANKDFIRDETLGFLNSFTQFTYSREFCSRDVGILVENIAYDASFGGNEKSVESGLAYYNGVISKIAGQEIQTVAAINYLNELCKKVISNTTCPVILNSSNTVTYTQNINTALTGGEIATQSLNHLVDIITKIISNGPSAAPEIYKGTNVDAAYVSAEVLMQANRKFIQEDTINYVNNLIYEGALPYSEIKCRRDTGIIIDSIALDLLYPTDGNSQSTFAGLQYWNQEDYIGQVGNQLVPTVNAIEYLKDLSVKIIQNITPADDLIDRYEANPSPTQVTNLQPATISEATSIIANFDIIISIVNGNNKGWTDKIIRNGASSQLPNINNAVALMQANKEYIKNEVIAYVDATSPTNFSYNKDKCKRDVGYIIDCVVFDLLHGGNRQTIQAGLYYYGFTTSTIAIRNQEMQTIDAFTYLATLTGMVIQGIPITTYQNNVQQIFSSNTGTIVEANKLTSIVSTITNIINNGPVVAATPSPIAFTASNDINVLSTYELLQQNKDFLVEEVISYIDRTYNAGKFNYNEQLCYRDLGLIIDAVSQDILLGGNSKSIEAGLAYWNFGVSHVNGQETTTTVAINYARDLALQVVANTPVEPQPQTITKQIINTYFKYGGDYMPQQAIKRNFEIVTNIINRGPIYAPPVYQGSGLFALTGISPDDIKEAPIVVSVIEINTTTYKVGLNNPTVGFGTNSTLYFGETRTYPMQDKDVEELSLSLTGNANSWNLRKVDPIGSMGGSLVDGGVISERSPIQSFVYDAFTQLTQGGHGVHIKRDGYAQLVSVFTIFASVGVQVESGGIASIVNSNANFGDICLKAKGYGKRKFSGQIYNPSYKAFPESPGVDGLNQYYPVGFWPNSGYVAVYVPDLDDRPHISLVMEVIPPDNHTNEQGLPGFLNASPTTSTLTTGTIILKGISTDGIAIGNSVYVRDQFGNTTDINGVPYIATGTVVANLEYDSIVLSKALPTGGGEEGNPNYFDFYFCGNAYYTVLSSEIISNPQYNKNEQPIPQGVNILSTASTGGELSQIPEHVDALNYLKSKIYNVITNTSTGVVISGSEQITLPLLKNGGKANQFIDNRVNEIIDIVSAPDVIAAENIIKPNLRTKSGPSVEGGSDAVTLIKRNIDHLAAIVDKHVFDSIAGFTYDSVKCSRDAGYILDGINYDVAFGSNWNSVYSGIAYKSQTSNTVITNELVQTLGAINYLQDKTAIYLNSSQTAVQRSNELYYSLTNTIQSETNVEIVFTDPSNIVPNTSDYNRIKAKNLLIENKTFIQDEIVAWINNQIANATVGSDWYNYTYQTTQCHRDVGFIVDALCYDILYGGNRATTINARVYYSNILNEEPQTLAAFVELKNITKKIVKNVLVTTLQTPVKSTQNTSLVAVDNADLIIESKIDTLIGILISAINNINPEPGLDNPLVDWVESGITNSLNNLNINKATLINDMITYINDEFVIGSYSYNRDQCKRDVKTILQRLIYDIETGGRYNSVMCGLAYWNRTGTYHKVALGENVTRTDLFPHNANVNFYQRSYMSASGYVFEYVGAGTNYGALPQRGVADPIQSKETVQLDSGKVFFTSTDQNGDFRIGPGLVISQATGVLSGRTFTKSLFANLTPFILAIEAGLG